MSAFTFLVPAGVHDPRRPSGGNRYDVELAASLSAAGWSGRLIEVAPGPGALRAALIAAAPDRPVLLDGLLLEQPGAEGALPHDHVVPLLHMPPRDGTVLEGLRHAPAVVTSSRWTASQVRALLPPGTTVAVAPPGVRPTRLVSTSPSGRRIRCVAALQPHKGQDVLLVALGGLRRQEWRCELVGPGEPEFVQRLRALAGTSGIAGRVAITGPRPGNPITGLYAGADVLVLPSRSESYGMVLAEALACGVPVIAADTGGVREAVDPAATLLVRPGDPESLAAALRAWLLRADLRHHLTAAARDHAGRRRTWAATAETVADALAATAVEKAIR
ncbi:glycosyltransferase [Amnibacterium sp. CER49]|uniref:glycosyltransferase family 4 protein n=1 Tax=Amnibacterium sp. CER49 TaxID=3039161 RepID=UPI00244C4C84|nr:glycosyltransferase [Amnibacterium sp. CER49]MDH2443760.1 glycosyltransferase [Amnibacterium sp. CER49]